jgi:hypothetical protein
MAMQRRAHARFSVGFGAEVHTEKGVISAGTSDVSRGGCRLKSGRPLPEGVTVKIDLCLTVDGIQEADPPRLSVLGRIQWTAEGEDEQGVAHTSGVRFEDMTPAQGDWLDRILLKYGTPVVDHQPAVDVEIDVEI